MIDWSMVTALATIGTGAALAASAFFVWRQLDYQTQQIRNQTQELYVASAQTIFETWMDPDFQRAQQWILYELTQVTWREFVAAHRDGYGERAFRLVGSFYNHAGYIVSYGLLGEHDRMLLDTIAGSAIEVWRKIEPLVRDVRMLQHSTLFQDFEQMLPHCYQVYLPGEGVPDTVNAEARAARRLVREEDECLHRGEEPSPIHPSVEEDTGDRRG